MRFVRRWTKFSSKRNEQGFTSSQQHVPDWVCMLVRHDVQDVWHYGPVPAVPGLCLPAGRQVHAASRRVHGRRPGRRRRARRQRIRAGVRRCGGRVPVRRPAQLPLPQGSRGLRREQDHIAQRHVLGMPQRVVAGQRRLQAAAGVRSRQRVRGDGRAVQLQRGACDGGRRPDVQAVPRAEGAARGRGALHQPQGRAHRVQVLQSPAPDAQGQMHRAGGVPARHGSVPGGEHGRPLRGAVHLRAREARRRGGPRRQLQVRRLEPVPGLRLAGGARGAAVHDVQEAHAAVRRAVHRGGRVHRHGPSPRVREAGRPVPRGRRRRDRPVTRRTFF